MYLSECRINCGVENILVNSMVRILVDVGHALVRGYKSECNLPRS